LPLPGAFSQNFIDCLLHAFLVSPCSLAGHLFIAMLPLFSLLPGLNYAGLSLLLSCSSIILLTHSQAGENEGIPETFRWAYWADK